MSDDPNGGGNAFEPTSIDEIHGPERKDIAQLIPGAADSSAADEGTPPADPSRVSPADPAGGEPAANPPENPPANPPEQKPAEEPAPEPAPEPPAQPQAQPLTAQDIAAAVVAGMREHAAQSQPQRQEEAPDFDLMTEGEKAAWYQNQANEARLKDRLDLSHEIALDTIPDYRDVMGANNEKWDAYLKANPHVWPHVVNSRHPAKVACDVLRREQMFETIQKQGGLEALQKKAVEDFLSAYAPKEQPAAPDQQPAPAADTPQADNPAASAGDDPNTLAFPSPAIPTMMGDDRSAPPRGDNFKGPISLEELDAMRPGRKRSA